MSHEAFHELLALRLYGELDAEEVPRLDDHLAGCEACRRYAGELEHGLGRIRRHAREAALQPASIENGLELAREVRARAWRQRATPWLAAGAGFAAGVLVALAFARGATAAVEVASSATPAATGSAVEPTAYGTFRRATPPPLASTEGQLARFGTYLRR